MSAGMGERQLKEGQVLCPECRRNALQAPYLIPGTSRVHHAYCHVCDRHFPEKDREFEDPVASTFEPATSRTRKWKPEEELRRNVNRILVWKGFHVSDLEQGYRPDGSSRVVLGLPDVYVVGHGVRFWIEYKVKPNTPTDHQRGFQEREEANGGLYYLIHNFEELEAMLAELEDHPDWRKEA